MFGLDMMMAAGGGLNVDDVFATKTYTSGSADNSKIATSFDPNLVWHKARTSSIPHLLFDNVRPGGLYLSTDSTNSEANIGGTGYGRVTSGGFFDPGFAAPAVTWAWREAPKFFDIVTYTGNGVAGRQIAHDLGVKPGMIVVKCINEGASSWSVFHVARGATKGLFLHTTGAEGASSSFWNNSEPTPSAFSVGASADINGSGRQFVAYLFAHDPDPDGIIQCGQYVGNGSTNGPTVNLGWKPQFIMVKAATRTEDWTIADNKRISGTSEGRLSPNLSSAEVMADYFDFLTTGFRAKDAANTVHNASGIVYVYCAIREATA